MSGGRVTRHWVELDPISDDAVTAQYVPYDTTSSIKTKIESLESHGFGEVNDGENLGAGEDLYVGKDGVHLQFKSLLAGDNITLIPDGESVTISSTDTGEANTASNIGLGAGLYASKSGVDLRFKSLIAGTNVTLVPSADSVTISSTDTGEANDGLNLGAGHSVYSSKLGVHLQFRSIRQGANVSLTSDSNEITVAVPNIGEINTASNVGGAAGIWKEKSGVDLRFRSIIAGPNVSVVQNTDTIIISAATPSTKVREIEYFTLSSTDISNRYVTLTYNATDIEIDLTTLGGPSQEYQRDFVLVTEGSVTRKISWSPIYCTNGMVDILSSGDILKIEYNRSV